MPFSCPQKQHPDWKALVKKVGYNKAYEMFVENDFNIPDAEQTQPVENVTFVLKAADILNSQRAVDVFTKGKKANWSLDKILTELAVPKDQKALLLSYGDKSREDLLTSLLADFSYTVKVEIATVKKQFNPNWEEIEYATGEVMRDKFPTSYYSNLTVPGGTNYEENRIITPDITPSIKGHPQFAKDNDIGWFRSDDKHPFTGFLENLIASGTIKKVPCG